MHDSCNWYKTNKIGKNRNFAERKMSSIQTDPTRVCNMKTTLVLKNQKYVFPKLWSAKSTGRGDF